MIARALMRESGAGGHERNANPPSSIHADSSWLNRTGAATTKSGGAGADRVGFTR
jgi:hypothetical protein